MMSEYKQHVCTRSRGGEDHAEEIPCMAYRGALYVVATGRRLRVQFEYEYKSGYGSGGERKAARRRKYLRAGWLYAPGGGERGSKHRGVSPRQRQRDLYAARRIDFDGPSPAGCGEGAG